MSQCCQVVCCCKQNDSHSKRRRKCCKGRNPCGATQKYCCFVNEPIEDKSVQELAGIGKVLGCRLEQHGYCKVKLYIPVFVIYS